MGTGEIQLVSYAEEDKYIMGNPQITFFKSVYRKHTNFSIESIKQEFSGTIGFGQRIGCTLAKNGDLIHKIYLEVNINKFSLPISPKVHLGHALIKDINIEIGHQSKDAKERSKEIKLEHKILYHTIGRQDILLMQSLKVTTTSSMGLLMKMTSQQSKALALNYLRY